MKKTLILFATLSTLLGTFSPVLADEVNPDAQVTFYSPEGYSTNYNGGLYVFDSLEDKQTFDSLLINERLRNYNPIRSRQILIKRVKVGRKWINFNPLTPNWTKASSYNLSTTKSVSASGTFKYGDATLGIGATLAAGTSINIPADPNRYSRLGFEAEIRVDEYKIEMYDTSNRNKVIKTIYTKYPVIIHTFNVVKYK